MSAGALPETFTLPSEPAANGRNGRKSWLEQARERFQSISGLPRNWDSYGADAPRPECLTAAWGLAVRLASFPQVPLPFINATRDGGMHFEWEAEARSLSIEVLEPAVMHLHFGDWDEKVEEEFDLGLHEPLDEVVRLIGRVESRAGGATP